MKIRLSVILAAFFIVFSVGCSRINAEMGDIRQKEIDRITQEKIGEITQKVVEQKTEEITNQIIEQRTREITDSMIGDIDADRTGNQVQAVCSLEPKNREFSSNNYYVGQLIDTHVHMPVSSSLVSSVAIQAGFEDMPAFDSSLSIDFLACLFESEGIKKVFGFYLIPNLALSSAVNKAKEMETKHPSMIVAFFMPPPVSALSPSTSQINDIVTENKDLFRGIGEIAMEKGSFSSKNIEDQDLMEMYAIAGQNKLVIMVHPRQEQKNAVDRILAKYPNINFLLHGGRDIEGWIPDLLEKYDNAFYSMDANLVQLYGWDRGQASASPTKEEFLAYFRQNFESILEEELEYWKPFIEKYPDQYTWGTDRWYRWHFDAEVGGLLEEFGRSFIGNLDPEVQEKIAYKNAEKILETK